jgi:UPF0271 protein
VSAVIDLATDLNADVGEGFDDGSILPFMTSANIACGAHAGSAETIEATVRLALLHGVACGAHPSYVDRDAFGREELEVLRDELEIQLSDQISWLRAIVERHGGRLAHVKLHGALYHRVSRDPEHAAAALAAFRRSCPGAVVFARAGSEFARLARAAGFTVAEEAFADRRYRGAELVPRSEPGALLEDPGEVARQAVSIARDGLPVRADTLCFHGDQSRAGENARLARAALEAAGVSPRAFGTSR